MSCKLKGMQGFQNVLKYIAAGSGKVGGCGNRDCLSQAVIVMTRVAGNIHPSSRRNSGGRRLVLKPLGMVCLVL